MLKKAPYVLVALMTVLLFATAVNAEIPGGPFNTAFNIQNLSNNSTTCVINFYDGDGNVGLTLNPPAIAAGDVAAFFTGSGDFTSLTAGQYSAVVSCTEEVAAVVNFSDANSGASYSGLSDSDVGTTFSAPVIYNDYFNFFTEVVVQNATNSPIDITLEIFAPGNATPVSTETASSVDAFAAVTFDQSTNNNLNAGTPYSARITGTGNIAASVSVYGLGTFDGQLYSYNPFAAGSTEAYAPVIMNNYFGYNSALVVQNTGGSTASVTVTYSNGQTETANVQANSASTFLNANSPIAAGNTLYSATVTSNQPIVAVVNQSNGFNRAATYSAFSSGSTSVSLPIVLKTYFGYDSSVTCQNIGNAATTMSIEYASGETSQLSGGASIAAGGTAIVVQPFDSALNGQTGNYISSATVTASQPIVCIVNQDIISGAGASTSQDQLQSYNGINN